jgi:hypothetical protein
MLMKKILTLGSAIFCLGAVATFTACGDDSSSTSGSKGLVSCHTYNTVDEEGLEINEDCVEAEEGTASADTAKIICEVFKAFAGKSKEDWAEIGTGCPDKKAIVTCKRSESLTTYYYSLDKDQQALVVEGDDAKTCEALEKE